MSIDDKLKSIENVCYETHSQPLNDQVIVQIKQVFMDEGYINQQDPLYIEAANAVGRMTYKAGQLQSGQEWYDRAMREMLKRGVSPDSINPDIRDAIKRASGILK